MLCVEEELAARLEMLGERATTTGMLANETRLLCSFAAASSTGCISRMQLGKETRLASKHLLASGCQREMIVDLGRWMGPSR